VAEKEYSTRDKPAERGITTTNILLALLILGGGIFGTVVTQSMSSINESVKSLNMSITEMLVTDGITANELTHIKESMSNCRKFHAVVEKRLDHLERGIK